MHETLRMPPIPGVGPAVAVPSPVPGTTMPWSPVASVLPFTSIVPIVTGTLPSSPLLGSRMETCPNAGTHSAAIATAMTAVMVVVRIQFIWLPPSRSEIPVVCYEDPAEAGYMRRITRTG